MLVGHSLVWKRSAQKVESDESEFRRKKLKLSDLPISGAQRTAIDALLLTFKKSGEFDKLRKSILTQFESSDAKSTMMKSIEDLTEIEIERQANYLLSKDRRQASALIEGAVERSNTYKLAESNIEALVQGILFEAENSLRKFRRNEIGEDPALEELKRGGKTEAEYLHAFAERKQARMKIVEKENTIIREKEAEEKRQRDEERQRRKEEEDACEREKEREREEREEQRRKEKAEREKEREERELEYEREREERRAKRRREEKRYRGGSYDRSRSRDRHRSRTRSRIRYSRRYSEDRSIMAPIADDKDLETIALQELLKDTQKSSASTLLTSKIDLDDALEPPPRKILPPKSIVPRDPTTDRLSKSTLTANKAGKDSTPGTPIKVEDGSRAPSVIPSIEKSRESSYPSRHRSPSVRRSRSRSRERRSSRKYSRSPNERRSSRYVAYKSDRRGSRRHENDDEHGRYRPSRYDRRSRSRSRLSARPSKRDASRDRSRSRDRRYREKSLSRTRSPLRRRRNRSGTPPALRGRSRSKDPLDIDRYVPSTSRRSPIPASRRDRDRSPAVRRERDREDNYRPGRDRERSRVRERERSKDSRRPRALSQDSSVSGRETRHRYAPDEIDRYVPPTSKREDLKEFALKDRIRDISGTRDSARNKDRDWDNRRGRNDRKENRRDDPHGGERKESRRARSRSTSILEEGHDRTRDESDGAPPITGSKLYAAPAVPGAPAAPGKLHFSSLKWVKPDN